MSPPTSRARWRWVRGTCSFPTGGDAISKHAFGRSMTGIAAVMVLNPFVGLSAAEIERQMQQVADETFVIPQPECRSALDEALETLAIPEVRMLFVATGDASRELSDTGSWDWYHPKLRALIESLVEAGKRKGAGDRSQHRLRPGPGRACKKSRAPASPRRTDDSDPGRAVSFSDRHRKVRARTQGDTSMRPNCCEEQPHRASL